MKIKIVQSSWTRGQISEKLNGRSDTEILNKSASVLENAIVLNQGGIAKRAGTKFLLSLNSSNSLIIPFECIFGKFLIIIDNVNYSIYNINNNTISSIATPFGAPPKEIKYAQNNNIIIFTHYGFPPYIHTQVSAGLIYNTNYTLTTLNITWAPSNDFIAGKYDSYYFSFKKVVGSGNDIVIGDIIRIGVYDTFANAQNDSSNTGTGAINSINWSNYIGGTFVAKGMTIKINSVGIYPPTGNVNFPVGEVVENSLITQLPVTTIISGRSVYIGESVFRSEHPNTCLFFQNRLWFGGTYSIPNGIWASATDRFTIFESGIYQDSSPLDFKINSLQAPIINNLIASKTLIILTDVGEFAFINILGTGAITASNINISLQSRYGASTCLPREMDNQLYYVQKGGSVIRATTFSNETNSYDAINTSITSPEIIRNPIDSCVIKNLNNDDNSFLLFVNSDGTIACLQAVKEQEIVAWSIWSTGLNGSRAFKAIASIDNRLFCITYSNFLNLHTLEEFDMNVYGDCQNAITISNGIGSVLINYNNNLVAIQLTSGASTGYMNKVVALNQATGQIIIDNTINGTGIIAFPIYFNIKTVPYHLRDLRIGDLLTTPKKLTDAFIYYYKSAGISIGTETNQQYVPLYKFDINKYNEAVPIKTEIYKINIVIDWSLLTSLIIKQEDLFPATILSIGVTLNV